MSKKSTNDYSQKQLKIMKVAMQIFAEKGYNGASVRDIAQASKVNLAMINYYFGSKLQLLEAIFDYMSEVSKNYFATIILDSELSPIEKVDQIIENYVRFSLENNDFIIILIRRQFNAKNDAINDLIYSLKSRYWKIFHTALQEAKRMGDFREDADVTTITGVVMGTLNFLVSDRYFLSKIQNLDPEDIASYNNEVINKSMTQVKAMLHNYLVSK